LTDAKVRENRVRRAADRQGLRLSRTRRRDPLAVDFGTYTLTDTSGTVVAGPLTIDEVEKYLSTPRDQRGQ